jgi:hypothetical protein
MSGATLRSLLDGVGVCEGATCGDLTHRTTIPVTQFTYQEDDPSYDMWHVVRPGQTQPVGPEWRLFFTGDLDGDGIRDRRYQRPLMVRGLLTILLDWVNNTPQTGQVDFDNSGRVAEFGLDSQGHFAYAHVTCSTSSSEPVVRVTSTNWCIHGEWSVRDPIGFLG